MHVLETLKATFDTDAVVVVFVVHVIIIVFILVDVNSVTDIIMSWWLIFWYNLQRKTSQTFIHYIWQWNYSEGMRILP